MGIVKKFKLKSCKKVNTVIQLDKVSLFYGKRQVLENINLKINQSEIFGVLGPNGSGKTTIMNLVVGIVRPSSGRILINGEDVTSMPIYERVKRHRMTVIPQRSGVFWELTCKECLLAIGELHIPDKKERIQMAETLISDYYRQHKLDVKIVRIFNTYGPRMNQNDGRVVSNFIISALKGEPITIHGDGLQSRCFCYISELVDAIYKMMKKNSLSICQSIILYLICVIQKHSMKSIRLDLPYLE